MKTIIISAFPGCGKTFLSNKYNNKQMVDKDNGFLTTELQFRKYAQEIIALIGHTKYILVSQYPEVLRILHEEGYKYVIVSPKNSSFVSNITQKTIKQQWFGRFILRKNNNTWIANLMQNYDN